jgi:hypothetical protein
LERSFSYGFTILLREFRVRQIGTISDNKLPDEEKRKQLSFIQEKARQLYDITAGYPADEAVPEKQRDAVWAFLASEARLSRYILTEAVTLSVEDSLSRSPEAASLIPSAVAERIRGRHALVATYEGKDGTAYGRSGRSVGMGGHSSLAA